MMLSKSIKLSFILLIALATVCLSACGDSDSDDNGTSDGDLEAADGDADSSEEATDGDEDSAASVPYDWCESDTPPDAECFAQKRDPDSERIALAREIADTYILKNPAAELEWIWENAVMLTGFVELYRVTGDTKYRDYYRDFIDTHIDKGYTINTSDTCAPSAMAIPLYMKTGEEKYMEMIQRALTYLYEEAERTEHGGLSHLGPDGPISPSLWIDSLFMFGNVLIHWGEYQDDEKALNEITEQFRIFTELLQTEEGFYIHAWGWMGQTDEDIFWARGNSWVVVAGADYLRMRLNRGEEDAFMQNAYEKLSAAVISAQDLKSGLWWTLLNRPDEIYLETSGSALFAQGLARGWRNGLLDDSVLPVIENAVEGVESMIVRDKDGLPVVTGISAGTTASVYEHYATRKLADDLPHGIGGVLMMLTETSGLPGE